VKAALPVVAALLIATPALAADVDKLRRDRGTLIPDGVIHFDQGASGVGESYAAGIARIAKDLKRRSSRESVLIVGHTDDVGLVQTNQRLSLARAAAVRKALIKRGVLPVMLSVLGVGATEPAINDKTEEARAKNRRVEFWLTKNKPIAHLTWIKRNVDAQGGEEASWAPAELHMPLMRLFRVRTGDESSSEVTFKQENKLFLESNALVVIYDSKTNSRQRHRVADVTLEAGSLFARLAKSDKTIRVKSPAAQVDLRSKSARLGYNRRDKTQRVAVYDGSARVSAQGRSVTVPKGQGTRIRKGRPPEKPRRLPMSPRWVSKDPIILYQGSSTKFRWVLATRTSTVEVQFAEADDIKFERPIRQNKVTGDSAKISEMPLGAYRIRLSSIDRRGLMGKPSASLRLLVLPQPLGTEGQALDVTSARVELPAPGVIKLPTPEGVEIQLGDKNNPAPPSGLRLPTPGRYTVPFRVKLADGSSFGGGILLVTVNSARIVVPELAPEVLYDQSTTRVRFQTTGSDGSPVVGMRYRANRVGTMTPGLAPMRRQADGQLAADLSRCQCESPDGAVDVVEEGGGFYSFLWKRPAGNGYTTDIVRVVEQASKMIQEFEVPIGAEKPFIHDQTHSGFMLAFRGGVGLMDESKPNVRFDLELGGRLNVAGPFSIDLGVTLGYFRTGVRVLKANSEAANIIPIFGRASLVFDFDSVVAYVGGGGGLQLVESPFGEGDPRGTMKFLQFGVAPHAGLGVGVGPGELHLEFAWPLLRLETEGDLRSNLGPTLTLGYRWRTWQDVESDELKVRDTDKSAIDVSPNVIDF